MGSKTEPFRALVAAPSAEFGDRWRAQSYTEVACPAGFEPTTPGLGIRWDGADGASATLTNLANQLKNSHNQRQLILGSRHPSPSNRTYCFRDASVEI
jgi:hypothetical protein